MTEEIPVNLQEETKVGVLSAEEVIDAFVILLNSAFAGYGTTYN
jgi:hypothetical protein